MQPVASGVLTGLEWPVNMTITRRYLREQRRPRLDITQNGENGGLISAKFREKGTNNFTLNLKQ